MSEDKQSKEVMRLLRSMHDDDSNKPDENHNNQNIGSFISMQEINKMVNQSLVGGGDS